MAKKVAAFGPKLVAAWESIIRNGDLSIPCGTGEEGRKKAVALRYRLYSLRTAMRAEGHRLFAGANLITLSIIEAIENGQKEFTIRAASGDTSFDDILNNAGISVPDAPPLPTLPMEPEDEHH